MGYHPTLLESVKGLVILSVTENANNTEITFETDFGPVTWEVKSGCCSDGWIEYADIPGVVSCTITEVIYIELPNELRMPPHKCEKLNLADPEDKTPNCVHWSNGEDYIQYYGLKLKWAKRNSARWSRPSIDTGEGLIEFRNASNGYYGSSINVKGREWRDDCSDECPCYKEHNEY